MMGEEIRKKHRRNSDDGIEEGTKRRKHSHHRSSSSSHRRHHHRRHRKSKHEKEEEKIVPVVIDDNDDKEEGEILEEEEEDKKVESDAESGEIKPGEQFNPRDSSSGKAEDEIERRDVLVENDIVFKSPANRRDLESGDKDYYETDEADDKDYESVELKEKKREKRHKDRTSSRVNWDIEYKSRKDVLRTEGGLDSSTHLEIQSESAHGRSRSPVYRKDVDVEDLELARHSSRKHSEPVDIERNSVGHRRKSMPPEDRVEDKYATVVHSPYHDRYHEDRHVRKRTRSPVHVRDRRSRSRSHLQDDKFHRELDGKSLRDSSGRANLLGSREKARHEFDLQRGRNDRDDRHGSRDWVRDREKERSSSYSRNGRREDRHSSWDPRDRERERGRERDRDRHRDRDIDQDRRKSSLLLRKVSVSSDPDGVISRNNGLDGYDADPVFSVGKSPIQNRPAAFERNPGAGGLGAGTPKSERSGDMFCDDIFGESPASVRRTGSQGLTQSSLLTSRVQQTNGTLGGYEEHPTGVPSYDYRGLLKNAFIRLPGEREGLQVERNGLNDNWDDAEGYYSYRFGEVLDGRYEVIAAHGKGVFSTVVRAKDLRAGKGEPEEVAIKIIRNNDTMYKAGLEELVILKKLAGADPEDRRHCVRFISSFKYRNHLCLVFESLHMNLREVLKKFGRNIGLKLTAVRAYAKQLFIALKHLRNCGVLHCDIKPDNMLVNEAKNVLKLCDFGNAMFAGKNEITPYLVSRFYRAPEITRTCVFVTTVLGLTYDHPMDIWSVGCCLYELYSGKVLFPGPSNNDMLRLHMELKGPFPKKMLRKGGFTDQHFDHDLNFYATEEDPVTKKAVKRLLLNIKPKDIGTIITGSPGEDTKMLANFKDLLERVFVLDPEKRMTVSQALSHPFITGK
ncbi:hypothetical protein IFM89_020461 [Coptis chinensis]|uniref:Serine/threonine-protein kinase PRP4 homolog n=1 Tax=Coptis chinensis TaxID=261450 RepID=A0A835H480_9MAGN|nr:hypothetical protein IFM89_020461 [Coptis chinensis]